MTRLLRRLRRLVADALDRTRDLWPDIRRAYAWVHRAARILANAAGEPAETVRRLSMLTSASPEVLDENSPVRLAAIGRGRTRPGGSWAACRDAAGLAPA